MMWFLKHFFSRKGNEKFLIDFLNAILKIEIREEVNLEKLKEEEKGGRLDMLAFIDDEEIRRLVELREKWESDWNISMNWAKKEGKFRKKK